MKKIITILLTIFSVSAIFSIQKFNENYFYKNSLIVCFNQDFVNNQNGIENISKSNGLIKTGLKEFDQLSQEFGITDLKQEFQITKEKTWNDKGTYLQNIYKLTFNDNDKIENLLSKLKQDKEILWAEYETILREREYIPNDPMVTPAQLYWIYRTECPAAWDYEQGNHDVVIGIVDSGVKWDHEDLVENIWNNLGEDADGDGHTIEFINNQWVLDPDDINGIDDDGDGKVDDLIGWDSYDNDNNPMQTQPSNYHGTHVAGCAGAVGDNGVGISGGGMHISLMPVKCASSTQASNSISNGYNMIKYAADAGADIINCSWGGPGGGSYANTVVNYATSHGALVVVAAGNANMEHNSSYQDYPADCENAFNVAATDMSDHKAGFSDYGEPIDISAPGVAIKSTLYNGSGQDTYQNLQGTSMASPVVAGICGLIKSHYPSLTPQEIKDRIMTSADNIDDINPNYIGKLGAGRINAWAALVYDQIPNLSVSETRIIELDGDGDGVCNPGESVTLKAKLFNLNGWLDASNVNVTLRCNVEGVTILDSTSVFPAIPNGMAMWQNTDTFSFETTEQLPDLNIPFTFHITADASLPYSQDLDFEVSLSTIQAGWPFLVSGGVTSSPIIADINNDGINEVVFGDLQGDIHAIEPDGITEAEGFPVNIGGNVRADVAVGNLDADNNLEIAATNSLGQLFGIDSDGSIIFTVNGSGTSSTYKSNPVISDVNHDGNNEIIAMTFSGELNVVNGDGSEYSVFPVELGEMYLSSMSIADLNGDGNDEIIISATNKNLHAISTLTGSDISGFPVVLDAASKVGASVMTINENPVIFIADISGNVLSIDHEGNILYNTNYGSLIRGGIAIGDLDNDGSSELIFTSYDGNLHVTDVNGAEFENFPVNIGESLESTPILSDLDNDQEVDMIFGDHSGVVHAIKLNGMEATGFPINIGSASEISFAIGNLDDDNDGDIIASNMYGITVLDYKYGIGNTPWAFDRGSMERNANLGYFTGISPEENSVSKANALLGNYPNPFNPETTISYTVKNYGMVSIDVFNILGQKTKTLVNGNKAPGNYKIIWKGRNDDNKKVGSGIYFYRMRSGNYTSTKKMILLK